ncbi:MAG: glycoside hydrolase family 16 protein [Luteibaculaceae bacterium]
MISTFLHNSKILTCKLQGVVVLFTFLLLLTSCGSNNAKDNITNTSKAVVVKIPASEFKNDTNGPALNDSIWHTFSEQYQKVNFTTDVPVSGRYKTTVFLKSNSDTSLVWVEDYAYNPEDRTYNITGTMRAFKSEDFQEVFVVGSPLKAGKHNMLLHVKGRAEIQWIQFELVLDHKPSETILTQNMVGNEWEIVWADEFEGSGMPDTTKWTFDYGNWGWGNNELQFYTQYDTTNALVKNGNLMIMANLQEDGSWTSARLTTRGKAGFIHGKIEFKAKVPAEKGNWAAGWTLGNDYVDESSWPTCGEIDILESVGYEMDNETGNGKAHASAHSAAYYFKLGNQPTAIIDVKDMRDTWHTYSIEWNKDSIAAFVDDVHYFTYKDNSTEKSWPFNKAQNIILNLAMGGGWGGLMGMDTTVTQQIMYVDYVRVYQKK